MKDVSIPLKLINLLADGELHSKQQVSALLGVRDIAIQEYIQIVRDLGVNIFTVLDQHYYLHAPLQLLNTAAILSRLPSGSVVVLGCIDSTNQYLIKRLGTLELGSVCVAEYQAQGRGRRGRQWISPFGKNLYLSLYWRFDRGCMIFGTISLMVGVIIAEVLQRLGAKGVRVKWPNDLYLNNRKLAGILIEISSKASETTHVVIGVGINLTMHESTIEIMHQDWISLQETGIAIDRNVLVAELTITLCQALRQFECEGFASFIARWRALDVFLNQSVRLLVNRREVIGVVRGIDSQGALLLDHDGQRYAYLGGNISLRALSAIEIISSKMI